MTESKPLSKARNTRTRPAWFPRRVVIRRIARYRVTRHLPY